MICLVIVCQVLLRPWSVVFHEVMWTLHVWSVYDLAYCTPIATIHRFNILPLTNLSSSACLSLVFHQFFDKPFIWWSIFCVILVGFFFAGECGTFQLVSVLGEDNFNMSAILCQWVSENMIELSWWYWYKTLVYNIYDRPISQDRFMCCIYGVWRSWLENDRDGCHTISAALAAHPSCGLAPSA